MNDNATITVYDSTTKKTFTVKYVIDKEYLDDYNRKQTSWKKINPTEQI